MKNMTVFDLENGDVARLTNTFMGAVGAKVIRIGQDLMDLGTYCKWGGFYDNDPDWINRWKHCCTCSMIRKYSE